MYQPHMSPSEVIAVKAFRVKLTMERLNVTRTIKGNAFQTHATTSPGHISGEFDITGLPMPVKKHIIIAGVIQGDIFQYGDGFSCIKEIIAPETRSTSSKTLILLVRAETHRSYATALEIVETLMDEVLEPQKETCKRQTGCRSWSQVLTKKFDIEHLAKPVISHLITKGIIKGEIYQRTGAIVNAKGSPYLTDVRTQDSEPPLYLWIQGPRDKNLFWAVERIQNLIKEAEEINSDDTPEIVFEGKVPEPRSNVIATGTTINVLESGGEKDVIASGAKTDVKTPIQYTPFLPQLGQTPAADVERCRVLVQWLLAHPLLVSFMACPPKDCASSPMKISLKGVTTALLCIPIYDQYKCTHLMPNQTCQSCHWFFSNAKSVVEQCFQAVANRGYDISMLMSVDDYIRDLAKDCRQIGVLYDYPLPSNMYYRENCRLFIDLVINYGLSFEESDIESYLKSTKHWYPLKAYQKIVVNPSAFYNSANTELLRPSYPLYSSLEHHGGLINFHLETIGKASPGRLFPADALKIPMCKYFPFLNRLSAFSKLHNFTKKDTNVSDRQPDDMSGSISLAAYQLTREMNTAHASTSSQESHEGQLVPQPISFGSFQNSQMPKGDLQPPSSQHSQPDSQNVNLSSNPLVGFSWRNPLGGTQPKPKEYPTSSSTPNPGRLLRKQIRKAKREGEAYQKREEVNKTIEELKEKHGTNSFWTMNPSELTTEGGKEKIQHFLNPSETTSAPVITSPLFTQNMQQVLGNMQLSMPTLQPTLFGTQFLMPTTQESKSILETPLLNTNRIFGQQPENDVSQMPKGTSQQTPFSTVISQLKEYIEAAGKTTAEGGEASGASQSVPDEGAQSEPSLEPSTDANNGSSVESSFSTVIQQLQQFIDSNNKDTSAADRELSPTDRFKKPLEPVARKEAQKTCYESKPGLSPLKRQSSETIPDVITKPKHICTDNSYTEPSTSFTHENFNPQNQEFGVAEAMNTTAVMLPKSVAAVPTLSADVSILGDTLLQRARSLFGGSANHDCRADDYALNTLTKAAKKAAKNEKLHRYCLVMCGVLDIIHGTTPNLFLRDLKPLLNFLCTSHHVFLVTLPSRISTNADFNKPIGQINGMIMSFQSKVNVTVIPFHKVITQRKIMMKLLRSIHQGEGGFRSLRQFPVVLSDYSCQLIKQLVEEQLQNLT